MDPVTDLVAFTADLVDIDSTTGREGDAGRWLAAELRDRGYAVVEQSVESDRFNVYARSGEPAVVLSTHYDCVPPFYPSRVDGRRVSGRGSCDAKGILAAQVAAADLLRASGMPIGLLFLVGEERGSDGAAASNAIAPDGCRFVVNGEPTDNRLATATRGILRVKLAASGRAAHSAHPELGESAIEKLVDALVALRTIELPVDADLGRTHYTVGLVSGGVAPNVVPASAEAEVLFRIVGDAALVRDVIGSLDPGVAIEQILEVPPVRLLTVPGFETAAFPYTTDIPLLKRWGQPLLFGPGSVHVAHTLDESVEIDHLIAARDGYVRLVRDLTRR
jgi:acetylornithine deacetylase